MRGESSARKVRPIALTVISWSLLVIGAGVPLALLLAGIWDILQGAFLLQTFGWVLIAYFILPFLGFAIASAAMLFGKNWGRWMLILLWPLRWLATLALFGRPRWMYLLPEIAIYLLVLTLLLRPAANAYFSNQGPEDRQERIGQ